jgi:hypothetical protein
VIVSLKQHLYHLHTQLCIRVRVLKELGGSGGHLELAIPLISALSVGFITGPYEVNGNVCHIGISAF